MTLQPPPAVRQRPPRMHLADAIPAVLRFADGHRALGKLRVVSVTGGLLSVSRGLSQGSTVKLMFVTNTGPVLGAAQLLSPVLPGTQPFRFVTLGADAQRRLQSAIQSSLDLNRRAQGQIEKYRAW